MFGYHDYRDGQRIQFTKSGFFASDIALLDASGNAQMLSEIELIDLSMTDAGSAAQGVTLTYRGVAAEKYQGLRFGFGVASDINATTPADYGSSSPLSNTGNYWLPWTSYIFFKTEGNLDTLADGADHATLGFAYHTGTDALYRILTVNAGIDVPEDGTVRITYDLDMSKVLGLPGAPLDIKAKPQNHNPQDSVYVRAITDHVAGAFTVTID
jgi:hypothetical protein